MAATCDRAEAVMLLAAGNATKAASLLGRAVEGFERLSFPLQVARSRELLARCGGSERDGLLAAARRGYAQHGAVRDLQRLDGAPIAR